MTALLNVTALDAFYGDFQALFGIDLELHPGEAVAVIGANGSGKSTLLKSLAGLSRTGRVPSGWPDGILAIMPPQRSCGWDWRLFPRGGSCFPR